MTRRLIPVAAAVGLAAAFLPAAARDAKPAVPAKADLPPKNFSQPIPGSNVAFDMVYVPGGEFEMGSPDTEAGRKPDEGPRHKVVVKPYWIGKLEVTWDEFDQWWKNEKLTEYPKDLPFPTVADAITRPTEPYVPEDYGHERDGHPAICMTHHAAMMYCHWLATQTGRGYRLPTEAEWEFACRAGETGPYGFPAGEKLDDYAWYAANSPEPDNPKRRKGTTHKPGSKRPNKFGIHDMHGNVWEYCLDYFDPNFYQALAGKTTVGPVNKPGDKKWSHTVRGGSFRDPSDRLRSAARWGSDTGWMKKDPQNPKSIWWLTEMDHIGFRVCLPAVEYPELVGLKPMVLKKSSHDPVTDEDK
jgi:formylglycine-generating enzyme required for sulfatase activity